jgi:hypothetical protein
MLPLIGTLLLVGCGSISFQREQLAFLLEDQKARYNEVASYTNEACEKHALTPAKCEAAAASGVAAVKDYTDMRTKLLAHDTVDGNAIVLFLLKVGAAIGHAYGIPIPTPTGVRSDLYSRPALAMPMMP